MKVCNLILAGLLCGALSAQDPPLTVDSLLRAARASYAKGDYNLSKTALEQAWSLAEVLPPENPRRYEVLKQQYSTFSAAGQYPEAEQFLLQAIAWRETTLGADSPKVADDLTELAMLCRSLKDLPRGLSILQRVSEMHMRNGGMQTTLYADDLSRMALLEMENKDPERAARSLRVAVVIRENVMGTDHPSLLTELIRLGTIFVALRDYENAEQTYRRALVIHERTLGASNPDLIPTVEGLAYALYGQKKYLDAELLYKRLIALWEIAGGGSHPMLALTLDKVAVFYREQDKIEDADAASARANTIRALFYANGLSERAVLAMSRNQLHEAEQLYRRAADALDPARSEHKELLAQIETNLKHISDVTLKPPAPRSGGKSSPKSIRKP